MKKIIRLLAVCIFLMIIILYVKNEYNIDVNIHEIQKKILNEDAVTTKEELIEQIQKAMINYKEGTTIKYIGSYNDIKPIVENPLDYVSAIDDPDTSSDYDYLKYIVKSINVSIKGYANILELSYHFTFRETKEETKEVDKKVKEVIKNLGIMDLSNYEKVKEIHDYIIKNATYDMTYHYVTAYDNLIKKTSVCQGYAALTYKMMTEAKIPCRIINGMAGGDTHAWNIVYINGAWYNIDCTWDDPVRSDGKQMISYDNFLKSDADLKDHQRDKEYKTKAFYDKYPMATESYAID
ncbi:transglutaminase domain-containing protein [Anaeromicropila herbilytica]|uniref:Transglutaminase-like domain-containing protein n=1 Tax=Anaeromicropila herbilytica TaxID=2785025 RepID=A0A7R7EIB1_9FIRM|nr:transglutaminase family protein [Anaeromicropila herbilytica]BCN28967.1 hypothetical protein bsdtb5_02620 [Anaeromicropila herbilytica]